MFPHPTIQPLVIVLLYAFARSRAFSITHSTLFHSKALSLAESLSNGFAEQKISNFGIKVRDFLSECASLGSVRFVVVGSGAILETTGAFKNLRYTDIPSKGTLATVSLDSPAFENHIYVDDVASIKLEIVKKLGKELRVIRFKSATGVMMSIILNAESNASAWDSLIVKFGEELLKE